jgi:hypothetical protein
VAALPNCLCGNQCRELVFHYQASPAGETRFDLGGGAYERLVYRCGVCGHMVSVHDMDLGSLYQGGYLDSTYAGGLAEAFRRIRELPPHRSDNAGRVRRVMDWWARHGRPPAAGPARLLDVGSGLAVFPAAMKEAGWECTVLDMDPRQAEHARSCVGVEAHCGRLQDRPRLGSHHLVSYNKVLEHVEDPIGLLAAGAGHLARGGLVYLELPDGELAAADGPEREEFFLEHYHVFSLASLAVLAHRAGFACLEVERLREPSDKYTLRALLKPRPGPRRSQP